MSLHCCDLSEWRSGNIHQNKKCISFNPVIILLESYPRVIRMRQLYIECICTIHNKCKQSKYPAIGTLLKMAHPFNKILKNYLKEQSRCRCIDLKSHARILFFKAHYYEPRWRHLLSSQELFPNIPRSMTPSHSLRW